ncbi:calcipressin-2 [Thrips palmi]|uniref:Calcipressin-2 n=1 Tax=Thrips palmi TaxID=161013 RepID=A0A6P9A6F2_THRPL|nr:calcipressin-2 [Thrips palmi]XP_034252815.1 calcipressin-2 [Thrips palmi]XP_034252816.1 calcipressin-2 [Thrips palmi]XP_034252817.1 calcipressin-2 [Thrips palmi]
METNGSEQEFSMDIGKEQESDTLLEGQIINSSDGLPNIHPNFSELELHPIVSDERPNDGEVRSLDELIHDEDLPTSLIVTNLGSSVFENEDQKIQLEAMFRAFGEPATFQFFRSFKRLRVNYGCPASAAKARIQLHQTQFGDRIINCYFAQTVSPVDIEDQRLQLPPLTKQFLISPPASPPVGWEPHTEAEPLVNYDLLAAISRLTPGDSYQLHAPSEHHPGIVVHVCEEESHYKPENQTPLKGRIPQTRCPDHN